MAPWAIGTDTGGSVRIPAAWNGITGLKTTIGRVSTFGVLPLEPDAGHARPDHARRRGRRAAADACCRAPIRATRRRWRVRDVDPMPGLRRGVKGLRLGRLPASERDGVDAEVLAAYDRVASTCWPRWAPRSSMWRCPRGSPIWAAIDRADHLGRDLCAMAGLADDNAPPLDQDVRPRVRAGAAISSKDYLAGLAERERMKRRFNAAIDGVDALLTPTMHDAGDRVASIDQNTTPAVFTRWVKFLDLCAAAVPNGFTAGGLPPSLQIVCRAYEEPIGAADRLRLPVGARLAPAGAADGRGVAQTPLAISAR